MNMIKTYPLSYNKHLIISPQKPVLEDFLASAQVTSGSYAETLAKRCWYFYLGDMMDVRDEYARYYSPEYSDIREFLFKKYMCPETVLNHDACARALDPGSNDFIGLSVCRSVCLEYKAPSDAPLSNLIDRIEFEEDVLLKPLGLEVIEI